MNIREEIKEFIREKFLAGSVSEVLENDSKLLDEQIIDSSGVLVMIMHIEKTYNIRIDDSELIPDNFNSINFLAELIESKIGAQKMLAKDY